MSVSVIIPAGGQGKRMNTTVPKQYIPLKGKPVIYYTIERFLHFPEVSEIIIPVHFDDREVIQQIITDLQISIPVIITAGGKERQDSVWNGMLVSSPEKDYLLVHDAVRPFFSGSFITSAINTLNQADGAVAGIPATNTIKRVNELTILETIPRNQLYEIQTPQMFRRDTLFKAFHSAESDGFYGTDEAMLVERIGGICRIIPDTERNIKITRQLDLRIAEILLEEMKQ